MGKRFWLLFNVFLAFAQFLVVALWANITAGGMGISAESNGVYSYFQSASFFKIIVATSKNESYQINYWPGIFAAVVLAGVVLSTISLWNKTAAK